MWYRNYSNNFNLKILRPQWRSVSLFDNITERLKGNLCSRIWGALCLLWLCIIVTVVIQNELLSCLNFFIVQWTLTAAAIACTIACSSACYHGSYLILLSSSDMFCMLLLFRGVQLSHVVTHMMSLNLMDGSTSLLRIWLIEFRVTATLLIITKGINTMANWELLGKSSTCQPIICTN